MDTSINSSQTASSIQHHLALNYINKEPFNEDLEIEECALLQNDKWRGLVVDRLRTIIEEIKGLQVDSAGNVS